MRKLRVFLAALLVLLFAVPAMAEYQDMWATVYKWTGGYNADGSPTVTPVTTGVTFKVLAAGANTAETLYVYGDNQYTSLTNPITTTAYAATTAGKVQFRVDPTDSTYDRYVDVIVNDATGGGFTAVVKNFDKYTHAIVIDERRNVRHHGVIWYAATTTAAVSTGVAFPAHTFVEDVRVEVVAAQEAATSINVGTGATAAAFRSGVATSATGYIADTGVITAGTTVDYTPATTYGTFLYTAVTGADSTTATAGGRSYIGYLTDATTTLYYTCNSATGAAYGGYLHYWFSVMR